MSCSDCGRERTVMLAMQPGVDGVEWHLCVKCWAAPSAAIIQRQPSVKAVNRRRSKR